jgi:hypothetical protein
MRFRIRFGPNSIRFSNRRNAMIQFTSRSFEAQALVSRLAIASRWRSERNHVIEPARHADHDSANQMGCDAFVGVQRDLTDSASG